MENRTAIGRLSTSMDGLGVIITTWSSESAARWKTAASLAKWAGGLLGGAALLGAGYATWHWLATLHH